MNQVKEFCKHVGFLTLLIVIALLTSNININAYPEIESYKYLDYPDGNSITQQLNYQNHVIYSKISQKWYVFDSRSETVDRGLYYTILNYDGSIFKEKEIVGEIAIYDYCGVDFDVKIDKYGEKGYIYATGESGVTLLDTSKQSMFVIYFLINEDTLDLDFINVWSDSSGYEKLHIVGTITNNGYPVFEYNARVAGDNYQNIVVYSNSTTSFNEVSRANIRTLVAEKGYNTYAEQSPYPIDILIPWRNGIQLVEAEYNNVNKYWHCAFVFQIDEISDSFDGYAHTDYDTKVLFVNNPYDYVQILNWGYGYNFDNKAVLCYAQSFTGNTRQLRTWEYDNVLNSWTHRIVYSIAETVTIEYPVFGVIDDEDNWAIVEGYTFNNTFRKWVYDSGWIDELLWNYDNVDTDNFTYRNLGVSQYSYNFSTALDDIRKISVILVDGVGVPDEDNWISFFGLNNNTFPSLPINYIKLDNIENNIVSDYGVIIFPNESHNIEMNFNENVTYVFVDIEDAENYVRFTYNITSNVLSRTIINKKGNEVKNIVYVDNKLLNDNEDNLTFSFDFTFNNDVIDYYSQILDYGLLYESEWFNFTSQIKYSLFNEGGIPVYSGDGTYNIYSDNDIFSIGAYGDGSYIRFDVLYNKLQHMHFNVELDIDGDWNSDNGIWENCTGGLFEYGWDYFINDGLLEGWKVRIYPSSVVVGHQKLGVDYDYVQWTIEHYFFNRTLDDYQLVRTDFLYSNFNGYDNENATPDFINRTSTQFWFDMWFSNDNSSKKVATRINSEWFGIYEQGASWWYGYGAFRPMIGNITNSIFYDNVYDDNMTITTIKGNVDLVRFWGRVEKVTGGNKEYIMHNYLMKNKVIAQGDMIGVDTPALVETKVLDMPQTGFLAPLIKVLSDIQKMIINGIIGVISYLGVLLDSVLVGLGLPPLLSIFYSIIVNIYDIFALLYNEFINIMVWVIDSLGNVISSIFLIIPRYILFVGMVVDVFVAYYNNIVLMFTGGIEGMGNFWSDYPVVEFIELYLIAIFPFIEIAKIESSDDPLGTLTTDVHTFIDLIMGIFHFVYALLQVIMDLIGRILGILPF